MKGVLPAGDENEMELLGRTLCNCKVDLNAISSKKKKSGGVFPFPGHWVFHLFLVLFFNFFLLVWFLFVWGFFLFFCFWSSTLCILIVSPEMKLYPILYSYSERNSLTSDDSHKLINLLPQAEK